MNRKYHKHLNMKINGTCSERKSRLYYYKIIFLRYSAEYYKVILGFMKIFRVVA